MSNEFMIHKLENHGHFFVNDKLLEMSRSGKQIALYSKEFYELSSSSHQDYICQKTYSVLYGREFGDFRVCRSDTDDYKKNPKHDSGSDSESDAASDVSDVCSEWQEETDCNTEHDSVATKNGSSLSTMTLPVPN